MSQHMRILRHRESGERVCVHDDPLRYPESEWELIEEGVTPPRGRHVRKSGRWVYDEAKRGERVVEISAAMWDDVQRRLATLQDGLDKAAAKIGGL